MTAEQPSAQYPGRSQGYYCVAVMTLAMTFAFIDRQIPAMLVEPIKADLGLSDTQIALLGGVAFSICYAVMAMPIGFAVDRMSRTRVIGTGVLIWSVMTTLAGFANSFAKLFGARIGVAVGEAVIAPTSVSLVGDYYPPDKQGRPLGIISSGVYIGMGLALLSGGFLIDYLTGTGGLTLPLLGHFKPWQGTFLIVGIPGIVVAIAAYLIHEPKRFHDTSFARDEASTQSLLDHLRRHRAAMQPMFAGVVFMGMLTYSFTFWAPTMMVRTYDLSLSEVGVVLGLITIVSSVIGTIASGIIVDRMRRVGRSDAPVRIGMFASLAAAPFAILAPLMPTPVISWVCIFGYLLIASSLTPLALLCVSGISTSLTRGRMTAIYALVMMVFSMSIGPQMTAFFTDYLFNDTSRLNWSLALTAAIVMPAAALFFGRSMPHYRRSVRLLASM